MSTKRQRERITRGGGGGWSERRYDGSRGPRPGAMVVWRGPRRRRGSPAPAVGALPDARVERGACPGRGPRRRAVGARARTAPPEVVLHRHRERCPRGGGVGRWRWRAPGLRRERAKRGRTDHTVWLENCWRRKRLLRRGGGAVFGTCEERRERGSRRSSSGIGPRVPVHPRRDGANGLSFRVCVAYGPRPTDPSLVRSGRKFYAAVLIQD